MQVLPVAPNSAVVCIQGAVELIQNSQTGKRFLTKPSNGVLQPQVEENKIKLK